jgi:hypothetical protein
VPRLGSTARRGLSAVAALLAAGGLLALAVGQDGGEDAAVSRAPATALIAAGGDFDYAVALAPLPARQLGPIALAAVERVKGRAREGDSSSGSPVLGDAPAGIPPPEWPLRVGGPAAKRGRAPFAARLPNKSSCGGATELGDASKERVAVLYASRSFSIGDDLDQLRALRLRAQYSDGLIAYINGREVARSNLVPDIETMGVAARSRGSEWETFYVPVVPGLLAKGKNTLAVEVRPSGRRLAPTLDLELAASARAQIVRGPVVQRVGPTSAIVMFDTDLPTTAVVEYGATPARGLVARSAGGGLAVHHAVELGGLAAGKAVHYRVAAGGDFSADLQFHTAPPAGEPIRFAVYGDVRDGHQTHGEIVDAVLREAPDFAVVTGDLVRRGSDEGDWQRFFAVAADLLGRVPMYPAVGNHDMGRSGAEGRRMNEIFALWPGPADRPAWGHWYSFDVSDIHLAMLDSNAYEHDEQLAWL